MARDYQRHDIYTFGAHLLESGDLDPVYIMLHKAELPRDQMLRWLVAYIYLYHCGAASYISEAEGTEFWGRLMAAAKNDEPAPTGERWPRGHERRHFRGEAAVKTVKVLWGRYFDRPEQLVEDVLAVCSTEGPTPFGVVSKKAQELPHVGSWMGFKFADLVDRVLGMPVDFDHASVFMFDAPKSAALMLWRQHHKLPDSAKPKDEKAVLDGVVAHLIEHFKSYSAPPFHDRAIALNEAETVLCCWKSHMNGHYPLNNDIDEIGAGLRGWGRTADLLQTHLPKGMR